MLATLFFLALASISHAATVTISASDPSISLTPGWSQQFSQSAQNSYIQTDSLLCDLTATLPPSATSVSYVGYKRAGGSTYGYTLDCEDDCILQTANGTDLSVSDDATALQSTIFSIDMDPSTQHTLRVYNIPSEASNGASKITFDHLSVLVQDHIPGNHDRSHASLDQSNLSPYNSQ
ncbi:hypothetical protein GGX14DRAFT_640956 [Mycena pura]|uniref:Uncharacterized protein n=1 Tax=Mycena pura TaxID=153505 RepID=A0AAD6YPW7_9AGAR|nr:hypothetical protein GGX14DRAFT_640956 [Mycena pura]